MKKRIIAIIALLALALTVLCACAEENYDFVEKTYIYEKVFGETAFAIRIREDGTYVYSEGAENGYVVSGSWSYKNGVITLKDNTTDGDKCTNLFVIEEGNLIFVEKGSTNFPSIKVADGEKFINITTE